MKKLISLFGLLAVLALFSRTAFAWPWSNKDLWAAKNSNIIMAPAQAPKAEATVQKVFDKLIDAVKAGDRDAFVADATEHVKEGMTKELMKTLKNSVGSRLKEGFQATYLCELKQRGYQVHLWKLTFKDELDDVVVRIALLKGKVAGFFFQ